VAGRAATHQCFDPWRNPSKDLPGFPPGAVLVTCPDEEIPGRSIWKEIVTLFK